jgi:hypothetical protein
MASTDSRFSEELQRRAIWSVVVRGGSAGAILHDLALGAPYEVMPPVRLLQKIQDLGVRRCQICRLDQESRPS